MLPVVVGGPDIAAGRRHRPPPAPLVALTHRPRRQRRLLDRCTDYHRNAGRRLPEMVVPGLVHILLERAENPVASPVQLVLAGQGQNKTLVARHHSQTGCAQTRSIADGITPATTYESFTTYRQAIGMGVWFQCVR